MNLSDFSTEYSKLSEEYKNIILRLLEYFEHNCEKRNELMAFTLSVIMSENEITKSKIVHEIDEEEQKNGFRPHSIREAVVSAIKRFSEKSAYFGDILNMVGVDIEFIENESFYYRGSYLYNLWNKKYKEDYADMVEWLWDTLSDCNKRIVYSLIRDLNNIDDFKDLHKYYDDYNYDYLNSDDIFNGE